MKQPQLTSATTTPGRSAGGHDVVISENNGLKWEGTHFWHWDGASYTEDDADDWQEDFDLLDCGGLPEIHRLDLWRWRMLTECRSNNKRRGTAAVEMALVLPVLLLLTLPIIDYCWYMMHLQAVVEATQVGARAGARADLGTDPVPVAVNAATASLSISLPALVGGTAFNAVVVNGDTIAVDLVSPFTPVTNFLPMPTSLNAQYRMRIEQL